MDLVNWSLSAVDKIFSTRKLGAGEPAACPDGTYAAGYTRDYYQAWQVLCLSVLDVEDVEDLFFFAFMVAGHSLIGMGITLVYRKIRQRLLAAPDCRLWWRSWPEWWEPVSK